MSKALYRKYRSKSLDEVIGQKHITDILSRAISQGHVSHAYLLTGPRGVGKTSVARILAYAINELPYDEDATNLDIIEIDAASNNGVEDVRDLREKVQIAPVSAKKKVYIIDEVHMLSKAAFNALLKTLEEPPEHIVFILATTNAEKLPATIISRTQQFNFRPISIDDAVKHLSFIAEQEKIKIDEDALKLIAQRSDGSFRDSISLLDQLSSLTDDVITTTLIEEVLGLAPIDAINQIVEAVETHNVSLIVSLLGQLYNDGVNSGALVVQLTNTVSSQVANKPQLLPLLDALIEVSKSPQPQLKLLSVLGLAAMPKQSPKTIALSTPVREISASVAELKRQVAKQKPSLSVSTEKKQKSTMSESIENNNNQLNTPAEPKHQKDISSFDWSKLVEYTKQNFIALYSVLCKCEYQLDGELLTIFTNNKFYKNKLDDTKYSPLLSKCLQDIGVYGLEIHTVSTTPPPKDDQAAAIAAIMGGGVEVSLETV